MYGSSVYLGRQRRSRPQGLGPTIPKNWGAFYLRARSMRNSDQILRGD